MYSVANCHSRMLYNSSILEVEHTFCLRLKGSGMKNEKVIGFFALRIEEMAPVVMINRVYYYLERKGCDGLLSVFLKCKIPV